jgi:membrane-associated PAP2 superfamily phosphatase
MSGNIACNITWRKTLGKKTLIVSLITLILVFIFFEYTNSDILIEDYFYNFTLKTWRFQDHGAFYYRIFYQGIKIPIYIIGFSSIFGYFYSKRKNIWLDQRKGLAIVGLTIVLLPAFIALVGKNVSNVHCPDDVTRYGGKIPYVKVLEKYPTNPDSPDGKYRRGHCFPAGHASGGFALLSLVCFYKTRRQKIWAIVFAMSMGIAMSAIQMLRGLHYFSHQLVTMLLAFIFVSIFNLIIKDSHDQATQTKK